MISNMNILKKLSFLIGVKMFVMAIFALWLLFSKYEDFDNAKKLENHIVLATYVSKTIHEIQKERGLTAGFLGSSGEKFGSNITEQRSITTKNIDTLNEILSHNSYDTNVLNSINEALKNLQNIESIRSKVANLSIDTKDAIGYYTQINTLLLQSVIEISKSSDSKIISTKINGYSNFLLAKETIGIQRAIGTNILVTQNPDNQTINKFISLIAMETSFLQNFQNYSEDTINQFFQKELLDSSIQKTATSQKEILEANYTTEPNVWFDTVTSKIDKFKEVEDYLSENITQAIIKEKENALSDLILMFVVGLIGWGFVFYITYVVTIDLTSKMKKFTASLLEFFSFIKKEKEDVRFIDIDSKDEFGVMAKVINENIQSTTIQLKEEKEFLDQVQKAIERLKNGQFNTTLSKTITSKSLELLRTKLNEMFDTLKILVANDLNKVNDVLRSYSNKDFTQSIDDNGQIAIMINELSEIINFMLLQNRDNGYLLQESSQTLLKNVAILNTSSNQSAASLEETAAAIEEITTTIHNNNEKIVQMNTIAQSVTKSANSGEKLARDTNDAMDEINTQIHSINDAIAVIDQIAFQTNILSLNAAVEAATAGEAGKGFAVVAGEVRNLATRSAEAAKEIKILVESATSKANSGKKIADEMILGYENLNGNINQTIKIIGDISASSKEQLQGMEQINNAINSLDKQTQQNASIASQTHQIASKTLTQADQLVAKSNEMKFRG